MRNLYIVIPVFHGWDSIKICLDHLAQSLYKDFCVVLVDHSKEGSGASLSSQYSSKLDLVCLRDSPDLWWTGATNAGIRWALKNDADAIMLLNHDCYVEIDTIEILMRQHLRNPAFILAPEQFDYLSKTLNCSTAYTAYFAGFPTLVPPIRIARFQNNHGLIRTSMIVGGRGVLIPADIFVKVGLLDEKHLSHYGSDNDFYLRCRKSGISLFIAADCRVYVDSKKTTKAARPGELTFKEFFNSLYDKRSHRNIYDIRTLFKRYYPIRQLYLIGVVLHTLRYTIIFLMQRASRTVAILLGRPT